MLPLRGLTTLLRRCVPATAPRAVLAMALLGLAPALAVQAADPQAEKAQLLDQNIQALKDEVLQFNRDALSTEESFGYPDHTRVEIYVSVETPALLMQKITVSVDGGAPVTYTYNELDSRALVRSKGLQRLARFNVARGAHRLKADFVAQYADAKEGDPLVVDRFDTVFDKTLTPSTLELVIGKSRRGGNPVLRLQEWRPAP